MTRSEICGRIRDIGVVPVVRLSSARLALHAATALAAGGISVVEITLTVPDAIGVIRELSARFAGSVLVGAGTVTSGDEARAAIQAGAQFIVSPGFDPQIIQVAHAQDVPAMPGVLTPTEIMAAIRAGADWVKIFPCSALGGPKYLRALRGPFPKLQAMPTGGVNLSTAAEYIAAGAVALGVGGELVDDAELAAGEYARLRERALAFVTTVRGERSKTPAPDITTNPGREPEVAVRTPSRGA
ncbi:MAG TPA: bifunctional 4-hydroxy-2-oxoglutarate aldolase/2-dehydro-3-deoxy-phosphogluconate aldolase [Polyangiales bacterium]|nr:bifunctional 4-hydroxy-2-oxoglutarate aldolase/2-dehydro-3-deoxy-phosphogluconate aldolase [Polyangiales bacterium]